MRSDSLVRWMAYSAIAYGAKALNYYCWGGAVSGAAPPPTPHRSTGGWPPSGCHARP